jgi:cyclophilin family peptidyl-prolyl cis-trans isomerase/HEAT repeat protein
LRGRSGRLSVVLLLAGGAAFAPVTASPATFERVETFAKLLRAEDTRTFDRNLLSGAAASPDPWLRKKAALAAGRIRDSGATELIAGLLRDPDAAVRRAAAVAAGVSEDRRLVPPLVRALGDPDAATAVSAAFALGKTGGPEAVGSLLSVLDSASPARAAAAMALFRSEEPRVRERLASLVFDPAVSAEVRRGAVYSLSRRPVKENSAALRAVLRKSQGEEDLDSLAWAARGSGILKDSEAVPDLVGHASSTNVSIAVQSLLALEKIVAASKDARIGEEARSVALVRSRDPLPGVSVAALRLLGRVPEDAAARDALEEKFLRKGWRGETALVSLTRLDLASAPERATSRLVDATNSDSLELKLGACETMEFVADPVAESVGAQLLSDDSARVRAAGIAFLSKRTAAIPDARLLAALNDPSPSVRAAALEAAVSRLESAPALVPAWERAFARSFGTAEPDDVVTALEAAAARGASGRSLVAAKVDDPDAVVRERARRLMVEKFGAEPGSFRKTPVRSGRTMADYRKLARLASGVAAEVEIKTVRGGFRVALDFEEAPATSFSFDTLAKSGFFNRLFIHRVVPDFVVQTGDPRGDGSGGPGFVLRDEPNALTYERGTVGMALSGPDTGGSQWFVALAPQPHLDGGYTGFGRVVSGMDVLDRIEQDDRLLSVKVSEKSR